MGSNGFNPSFYEVLGVSCTATDDKIKKAYRPLAELYRSDLDDKNRAKFEEITTAYEVLRNPTKRGEYDTWLAEMEEDAEDPGFTTTAGPSSGQTGQNSQPEPVKPPPAPTTFTATATASVTATVTVEGLPGSVPPAVSATASATATGSGKETSTVSQEDAQQRAEADAYANALANAEAAAKAKAQTEAEQRRTEQEDREQTERKEKEREEAQKQAEADRAKAARAQKRREIAYRIGAAVGIVALLAAVVIAVSSGGLSATEKERNAAEARVAQLKFECIERYACNADPVGFPPQVFINGMDYNLLSYLEYHGYTDSWTGNAGYVEGRTIGKLPPPAVEVAQGWAASERANGKVEPGHYLTGLMYYDPENGSEGPNGGWPTSVPAGGVMTITWRLNNPLGRLVKELRFSVKVVACQAQESEEGGEKQQTYCQLVENNRLAEGYKYEDGGLYGTNWLGLYPAKMYKPPPRFRIKRKNWGPNRTKTSAL